ncbi:uncharacterized protein LOC124475835 [Hypomesus transpacificus]|uniref:uncharacterized protein LOC124475835 n=1 Tax=Hypomesus transpacificus TaxID=137520 RepID=UPI001F080E9C|nr:uncharacterized protein LOC124475835 [Hypomesus transpacificus]
MMHAFEYLTTWIVMLAVAVSGQKQTSLSQPSPPNSGLRSDCLGNVMRLSLDKSLAVGNLLEVDAINGTDVIPLTSRLAAQCGYSMESDPWGNTKIYSSMFGCYAGSKEAGTFSLGLNLRMSEDLKLDEATYVVTKTCNYQSTATRHILCERNYIEVSTQLFKPQIAKNVLSPDDLTQDSVKYYASASPNDIWKLMFFTPEPKVMLLNEAKKAGYGVKSTEDRLVLRSPFNSAATYIENVAGVLMEVFSVSTYYVPIYGFNIVDSDAACPTGGLTFTDETITWHVPRRITPVIKGAITILNMYMGIDGQRLNQYQMAARKYTLTSTESHIVIELPIGTPDGYYKSLAPDDQYHVTFTIEPMLELVWREESTQTDTQYKVLFPITTPLVSWPTQFTGNAVPEERSFEILLGTFLPDVELINITFNTGLFSVAECNSKGFDVKEHRFPNGSKSFSLKVPFFEDAVLAHNPEPLFTTYILPMTFGLLILPEETQFSHVAKAEVSLQDVVLPVITGTCDPGYFYVTVGYGNQGHNFRTMIGKTELTSELAETYGLVINSTQFSFVMPYSSADSIFEVVISTSVRARIDLELVSSNNWKLNDFSLSCSFPLTTTECYSNGTMTALAIKVESVPNMILSHLTLRDDSCKPKYSDNHFAYFDFGVNSCGTTRTMFGNIMVYENDISLDLKRYTSRYPDVAYYKQTVSCYYLVDVTETMAFRTQPRVKAPSAEIGMGYLIVQMRLAQDESYKLFYQAVDYPVAKYLRQPLYFEVALTQSMDQQMELVLENCWATQHKDRSSLPRWNLIVDSCVNLDDLYVTVFHPVESDSRVNIPAHVKRFSVSMFTFIADEVALKEKMFVHCDAVICDSNNPHGGCISQCVNPTKTGAKTYRTADLKGSGNIDYQMQGEQLSSGSILLSEPE